MKWCRSSGLGEGHAPTFGVFSSKVRAKLLCSLPGGGAASRCSQGTSYHGYGVVFGRV